MSGWWGTTGFLGACMVGGCGGNFPLPATPGIADGTQVADVRSRERVLLRPEVCARDELTPSFEMLDETSLVDFLRRRGFQADATRARADLVYVEVRTGAKDGARVRLRVAILRSSSEAGEELDHAIRQHGTGSWGVHRANLAVLAPSGTESRILGFASKTELACWGVLTVAGTDDAYVVAGGYREL